MQYRETLSAIYLPTKDLDREAFRDTKSLLWY